MTSSSSSKALLQDERHEWAQSGETFKYKYNANTIQIHQWRDMGDLQIPSIFSGSDTIVFIYKSTNSPIAIVGQIKKKMILRKFLLKTNSAPWLQ